MVVITCKYLTNCCSTSLHPPCLSFVFCPFCLALYHHRRHNTLSSHHTENLHQRVAG